MMGKNGGSSAMVFRSNRLFDLALTRSSGDFAA